MGVRVYLNGLEKDVTMALKNVQGGDIAAHIEARMISTLYLEGHLMGQL